MRFGSFIDFVLLFLSSVASFFFVGERTVFKGKAYLSSFWQIDCLGRQGYEKSLWTLDVVFFDVYIAYVEGNSDTLGFEAIGGKMLATLDIVLVSICPVEVDLFAVVWDGISFRLGIASAWDEVTIFVVA